MTEGELSRLLAAALEGPARRAVKMLKGSAGSLEEQAKLADQGRRNALIYRVLFSTGLRLNEARLLTWGDIDLEGMTLTTQPWWQGNKSGKTDVLPLAPALVEMLKDWRTRHPAEDSQRVLQIPLKMLQIFNSDLVSADIPKKDTAGRTVDLHCLRHTHGCRLVASGADIKTVQALMRHATPSMTLGTYIHKDKGRMADAVASLPDVKPAALTCREEAAAAALKEGTNDAELGALPPSNRQGLSTSKTNQKKESAQPDTREEDKNGGRHWARTSDLQLVELAL